MEALLKILNSDGEPDSSPSELSDLLAHKRQAFDIISKLIPASRGSFNRDNEPTSQFEVTNDDGSWYARDGYGGRLRFVGQNDFTSGIIDVGFGYVAIYHHNNQVDIYDPYPRDEVFRRSLNSALSYYYDLYYPDAIFRSDHLPDYLRIGWIANQHRLLDRNYFAYFYAKLYLIYRKELTHDQAIFQLANLDSNDLVEEIAQSL